MAMLMEPLRSRGDKQAIFKTFTMPAPTKGWFVYDNLATMPPATAYNLDNFFAGPDFVRIRGGSLEFASGMGAAVTVETLMVYNNGAKEELFACADGKIYDVSAGDAVGAAKASGLTNNLWQSVMMTTTGGSFLVAVNGADDGRLYDGTTWSTTAITGATETDLNYVWSYKNRLYFVEKNSTSVWYLPVDSIGGAATELALGGVFPGGGKVLLGYTWSLDAGNGLDDVCVFISSEGEMAVYTGSYPGDAAWALKGVYHLGKPLGVRSVLKAGGDLAVLTESGVVALSKSLQLEQVALENEAITRNIQPEFRKAVLERAAVTGWEAVAWHNKSMFVISTPKLANYPGTQLVANMVNGAWSRFTGWDAATWAVFGDNLYFGTRDGRVMQADKGAFDDGDPYSATMFMSFTDLKQGAKRKSVTLARANFQATFLPLGKISLRTEYNYEVPAAPATSTPISSSAVWDTAVWDADVWPIITPRPYSRWQTVNGYGSMIAPIFQLTVGTGEDIEVRITSIDLLFEVGGVVG